MYQIHLDYLGGQSKCIKRLFDNAIIPADAANADYQDYLVWLAAGNIPAPPDAATIDERRAAAWEQIKTERTRRENGGVQVGGHWFQTDADSRIRFMRLDAKAVSVLAAGGTADDVLIVADQPLYWKSEEDAFVPMTAGLAQSIATAIENLDAAAFARGEYLRSMVNTSENPESVDITSGWPPVFSDV